MKGIAARRSMVNEGIFAERVRRGCRHNTRRELKNKESKCCLPDEIKKPKERVRTFNSSASRTVTDNEAQFIPQMALIITPLDCHTRVLCRFLFSRVHRSMRPENA
jgi:hypothetical protein